MNFCEGSDLPHALSAMQLLFLCAEFVGTMTPGGVTSLSDPRECFCCLCLSAVVLAWRLSFVVCRLSDHLRPPRSSCGDGLYCGGAQPVPMVRQ